MAFGTGGFGGGGGPSYSAGGGGGGYTGGAGGTANDGGLGGTSYNSGTNQVSGTNPNANGLVTITDATLSVVKQHIGGFTQGGTGEWDITVSNTGPFAATSGTTTVVDNLPAGYLVSGFSTTDSSWSCSGAATGTATCTSSSAIALSSSFPVIKLIVNIPATSPGSVTNAAGAYGGGDPVHSSSTKAAISPDTVSLAQTPAGISAFSGTPQSANVNTGFSSLLTAKVVDAAGFAIPNVGVTFTAPVSGARGVFGGTCNSTACVVTTDGSGVATAPAFTANTIAGQYSVAAICSIFNANFALTNAAGIASAIAVSGGGGQSAAAGQAFAAQLQAKVTDAYGKPLSGVTVTFAEPGGPSATFSPANGQATTNSSGIVSITAVANTIAGGPYTVRASINNNSAVTSPGFSLTNTPGWPRRSPRSSATADRLWSAWCSSRTSRLRSSISTAIRCRTKR